MIFNFQEYGLECSNYAPTKRNSPLGCHALLRSIQWETETEPYGTDHVAQGYHEEHVGEGDALEKAS